MEVITCRSCRRLFNYIMGPKVCASCREAEEKKFAEVKEFIQENKNATINVVAEEMEVSVQQLNQWIREERLSFSEDSAVRLQCEKCATKIRTGRYCDNCKAQMSRELSNVYKRDLQNMVKENNTKSKEDKMRFLGK